MIKVNALSYLTVRWHCGTQLPYTVHALFCVLVSSALRALYIYWVFVGSYIKLKFVV